MKAINIKVRKKNFRCRELIKHGVNSVLYIKFKIPMTAVSNTVLIPFYP